MTGFAYAGNATTITYGPSACSAYLRADEEAPLVPTLLIA